MKVLFLCTANSCRSILSEALFNHLAPAGMRAYGGVYVAMAIIWLWLVDGIRPTHWDLLGAGVALLGMAIIMFAPRSA